MWPSFRTNGRFNSKKVTQEKDTEAEKYLGADTFAVGKIFCSKTHLKVMALRITAFYFSCFDYFGHLIQGW